MNLPSLRRSLPTVAVAAVLLGLSATSGATAALVITGKQIKDGTVTTKDIRNGTLTTKDLSRRTVSRLKGRTGPEGPAGPPGPAGPGGGSGLAGYEVVTVAGSIPPGEGGELTATCPGNKRILGAASYFDAILDGTQEQIASDGTRAWAFGFNSSTDSRDVLNLDIVCATVR